MKTSHDSDNLTAAHDEADKLARELFDQVLTLRLVYRVADQLEDALPDEELGAVRSQLERVVQELDQLHNRLDLLSGSLYRQQEREAARELKRAV